MATQITYRDGLGRPLTTAEMDANWRSLVENKVEIVAGKGLSTNDYIAADKSKVTSIGNNATTGALADAYLLNRNNHTGSQAISTVSGLQSALDGKVGVVAGKGLSTNDYTTAEKNKLADLSKLFLGVYTSLSALQTAWPTATAGQYAQVDGGVGSPVLNYNWDANDNQWVSGGSGSAAQNTDQLPEGSANLYFTSNRVLGTTLAGLNTSLSGTVSTASTIIQAFGYLQNKWNNFATSVRSVIISGFSAGTNTAITNTDSVETALVKTQGQLNARMSKIGPTGYTASGGSITISSLPKFSRITFAYNNVVGSGADDNLYLRFKNASGTVLNTSTNTLTSQAAINNAGVVTALYTNALAVFVGHLASTTSQFGEINVVRHSFGLHIQGTSTSGNGTMYPFNSYVLLTVAELDSIASCEIFGPSTAVTGGAVSMLLEQ